MCLSHIFTCVFYFNVLAYIIWTFIIIQYNTSLIQLVQVNEEIQKYYCQIAKNGTKNKLDLHVIYQKRKKKSVWYCLKRKKERRKEQIKENVLSGLYVEMQKCNKHKENYSSSAFQLLDKQPNKKMCIRPDLFHVHCDPY